MNMLALRARGFFIFVTVAVFAMILTAGAFAGEPISDPWKNWEMRDGTWSPKLPEKAASKTLSESYAVLEIGSGVQSTQVIFTAKDDGSSISLLSDISWNLNGRIGYHSSPMLELGVTTSYDALRFLLPDGSDFEGGSTGLLKAKAYWQAELGSSFETGLLVGVQQEVLPTTLSATGFGFDRVSLLSLGLQAGYSVIAAEDHRLGIRGELDWVSSKQTETQNVSGGFAYDLSAFYEHEIFGKARVAFTLVYDQALVWTDLIDLNRNTIALRVGLVF
jgi:hypothetical protein